MTEDEERAQVDKLANYISHNLPLVQPVQSGIPAKQLFAFMTRTPHGWDRLNQYLPRKSKKRLIKKALDKLKAEGKMVTEPIISKWDRTFDRKTGTYKKRVSGWRYKWCETPLEALASIRT